MATSSATETDDTAANHAQHNNALTTANLERPLALSHCPTPEPQSTTPAPGITFEALHHKHKRFTEVWRTSPEYLKTRTFFEDTLLKLKDLDVTSCMCLCLGSLSGTIGGPEYRDNSMVQLVAFKRWVEILRSRFHITNIYMQDPAFNALDTAFLTSLSYTVISTPASDTLIIPTTFLFSPYGDIPPIISSLLAAHPSLMVSTDLSSHRWWWWIDTPTGKLECVPRKAERQREVLRAFLQKRVGRVLVEGGEGWLSDHWVYYPMAGGVVGEVGFDVDDGAGVGDEAEARKAWVEGRGGKGGEEEERGVCAVCDCGGREGAEEGEEQRGCLLDATIQRNFSQSVKKDVGMWEGLWRKIF